MLSDYVAASLYLLLGQTMLCHNVLLFTLCGCFRTLQQIGGDSGQSNSLIMRKFESFHFVRYKNKLAFL